MAFPESFLEELTARSEIVDVVSSYVRLSRKGSNLFGLCPFHNEKTPSFSVSPDKQIYHCFGCGKGGGVINFIMEIENLSFPDAVHFLASRAGMTVPEEANDPLPKRRRRLLELNREAARFFHAMLKDEQGREAAAYMEKRRIRPATATRFGLGYAPDSWDALVRAMQARGYDKLELLDAGLVVKSQKGGVYDKFRNRLMFPVIDVRGDVLGFGGRCLGDGEPKYLNSPETLVFSKRRTLYGINLAKNTRRGNMILCEGNIDVVTLHQAGFDNAVASMGTSLTTEQTRLISRYVKEIVLCYDNDEAGKKATDRALEILRNSEFAVKVVSIPNRMEDGVAKKQDVDDYIKANGGEAFGRLLSGSENHMEYRLQKLGQSYDLSVPEQKVEYLKKAGEMLARLQSPVEREVYGARAAETAGVSPETMAQEIRRAARRFAQASRREQERKETRPVSASRPREKSIRYDNVRSALAEEGLIRLLLLDPSLIRQCDIEAEEFSAPFLAKVYALIRRRGEQGLSLALPAFAQELSEEEMSRLTLIVQKPENTALASSSMREYIEVIRREKLFRSDDLMAIRERLKQKQGMEDKS